MIIMNFLFWLGVWTTIYYARQTCQFILPLEDKVVREIRDRIACIYMLSKDGSFTEKDLLRYMEILQILDFLYYTVFPALLTCAGLHIIRGLLYDQ